MASFNNEQPLAHQHNGTSFLANVRYGSYLFSSLMISPTKWTLQVRRTSVAAIQSLII
jgi:hypothetical protein